MAQCNVCFRHCRIEEGKRGFCGARACRDGMVFAENYGRLTALALDPIEKKPLRRFHPGEMILSVGSYGCNLRCPFCQNNGISWSQEALSMAEPGAPKVRQVSPQELARLAGSCADQGNAGIAFTYNEPLVGWEFVRDTAELVHEMGMVNVMVTNGTAELAVLEELLPFIDAMNIDLKGFTENFYSQLLGGDLEMVKAFIERAAGECHVELTTLIIPGENDSPEEMRRLSSWVAGLDENIPLHISRFFPTFRMTDRAATDVALVYRLAETAHEHLRYVYTGNC